MANTGTNPETGNDYGATSEGKADERDPSKKKYGTGLQALIEKKRLEKEEEDRKAAARKAGQKTGLKAIK